MSEPLEPHQWAELAYIVSAAESASESPARAAALRELLRKVRKIAQANQPALSKSPFSFSADKPAPASIIELHAKSGAID